MADEPPVPQLEGDPTTAGFALAEFSLLGNARAASHQGAATRFNFFLVFVSLVSGAIGLALNANTTRSARIALIAPLFVVLMGVGVLTFGRLLMFTRSQNKYNDGLNAMRTAFVTAAPSLEPFLLMPHGEEQIPRHGIASQRESKALLPFNLAGTTALINSLVFGESIAMALWALEISEHWVVIASGILAATVSYAAHFMVQVKYLYK